MLGRITAPFGVQGWVKVHAFGDDPLSWRAMPRWWLGDEPDWTPYELKGCRLHGATLIAKFQGVDERDAAEKLSGAFVAAPNEALPRNAPNEYYWGDLVGLDVRNLAGDQLGKVEELIESGAHAVICVRDGEKQRLLPFVAQVVKEVDLAGGALRVDWQRDW